MAENEKPEKPEEKPLKPGDEPQPEPNIVDPPDKPGH